jgi:hypothetical protein
MQFASPLHSCFALTNLPGQIDKNSIVETALGITNAQV